MNECSNVIEALIEGVTLVFKKEIYGRKGLDFQYKIGNGLDKVSDALRIVKRFRRENLLLAMVLMMVSCFLMLGSEKYIRSI